MDIPEPSLYELNEFVNLNRELFNEDEQKCLALYINDTKEKYSGGNYWLKGQLPMTPGDEITQSKLLEAEEIDKRRLAEYGGPCNGLEAASLRQHNYKFEHLQQVLSKYYDILSEEYLRPPEPTDPTDKGGLFYQKIAEQTLIGK
jgi:hypothetical protein